MKSGVQSSCYPRLPLWLLAEVMEEGDIEKMVFPVRKTSEFLHMPFWVTKCTGDLTERSEPANGRDDLGRRVSMSG